MYKITTFLLVTCLFAIQLIAQNNHSVKDDPKGAREFERMRTADPATGEIPYEKLEQARKQARQQLLDQRATGTRDFGNWTERGPNNFGGRTRAIMWDPNNGLNDHKVWAGGVDGGLWVNDDITDENSGWTRVFSEVNGFAISTITYDPNNTGTFYFGTGELWPKFLDNSTGNNSKKGRIWMTTNNGMNWSLIDSDIVPDSIGFINKLKVNNNGDLFAATEKGLYMYNSSTWIKELGGVISDIEIYDDNTILVAIVGETSVILKRNQGSSIYDTLTGIEQNSSDRIEIAIKEDDFDVIYAIGIENNYNDNDNIWFIRSINAGNTFVNINTPMYYKGCIPMFNEFTNGQGVYNIALEVSDNDVSNVLLGGVDFFSTNTGGSLGWDRISSWDMSCSSAEQMHADQHNILFDPTDSNKAMISNDGGIYYATNLFNEYISPSFDHVVQNYNVTQFYTCYSHPNTDYIIGGTQDNGSIVMESSSSNNGDEVSGGDGGFCFIDNEEPNYQIASQQNFRYRRSKNGGQSFNAINTPRDNKGAFINPSDYDHSLNILYAYFEPGVLKRRKKITSAGSIYGFESVNLTTNNNLLIHNIHAIRSSRYTTGTVYISAFVQDDVSIRSRVCKIENTNSDPIVTVLSNIEADYDNYINCISFGASENELLITSTSSGDSDQLFFSEDNGDSWQSKKGDLSEIPVFWAEFNPNNYNQVLIATEVGLYKTNDITQTTPQWDIIDIGGDPSLSLVRCDMIRVRPSDSKVYVATHGRGIWESDIFMDGTPVPDLVISSVNPNIPTAELNETITVDVTVSNIGNLPAAYNTSQCYMSDDDVLDDGDLFLFQESLGAIVNGQYIIADNWEFQIPGSIGAGNKYIIYKADGLEEVNEGSHENNNTLPVPITIYPAASGGSGPDMTVLNEFVSKRVIEQGQSFSVNCDVMNQGDEDATGGWKQKWFLSTDQTYSGDDLQLDFLQWAFLWSDSSNYIHREITMPTSVVDGEYYILIYIDSDDELTETVESNNIKTLYITIGTIPVPTLISPMDDEEEVSFTPTFYWEDLGDDVDTYDFAIYDYVTQNGNTYLQQVYFKSGLTEPEWQVNNFNFDYDEGYKWTARSRVNGTHGEWATLFSFQTKHYLHKPVLYDPNNYIANEPLTPTFTWNNVNNASYYKLVIAEDANFDNEVEDWSGLTDNWYTIPPSYLDTANTYYWRVKAYTGAGNSDYSQVFQFSTGGDIVPGQPMNTSPVNDTTSIPLSPQFVWETGNGVTLSYQLDISADSIFDSIVFNQNNIVSTNYFVPDGYLDGLSKYYWRVRAWNGAGYSPYSDSSAFTTKESGGPGSIKWFKEIGFIRGTPVFDSQGFMWVEIDGAVVKLNPLTADTIFTLPNFARNEFNEGLTLSHDGNTVYTIADNDIFGSEDSYFVTALDLEGNVLWYYDTYCRDVSNPALDAAGNMYVTLSDGYLSYEDESSVISLDPQGNLRWRGLVFDDAEEFRMDPVVKGDKVIVARDKINDVGSVLALNTSNGGVAWQRNFSSEQMEPKMPGLSSSGVLYGTTDDILHYGSYSNGSDISGWPYTQALDNWRSSTVIDELGNIFNGTDDDLDDGVSGYAYGFTSSGNVMWQKDIFIQIKDGQVLGNNGLLYFSSGANILYAVDKQTGDEIWSKNLNINISDITLGPDGTLYVATSNPGGLFAIETSSTGLNEGQWPVKVHDYQGTNCYDHVDILYTPTLLDFAIKNNQDTTRTINNNFNYDYLNYVTHYKISEDSLFSGCDWITVDSNYSFPITPVYGTKVVYFVMKNTNGNSDTLWDAIDYVSAEPIVTTDSISNLNISNLELLGRVNPNNLNSSYYMEYGPTTIYGSNSDTSNIIAGTNELGVTQFIEGLLPATTYHYRIVAYNSGGVSYGNDKTFTTYGLLSPVNLSSEVLGYQANITWSPPSLECFSCSILGYNVYRDSVLINTVLVTEMEFSDVGLVNGIYNYAFTAIYQEGESVFSDTTTIEIAGGGYPVDWGIIRTLNPHLVVIPVNSSPSINGTSLSKGDYLGVFYQRGNNEICGGAARWDGTNTISLIAYGDDTLSQIKDGFDFGEKLTWKMKTWDMDSIVDAMAIYDNSYSHWDGKYHEFGLSGLSGLDNKLDQTIELYAGWNMASFYVSPQYFQMDSIFQSLIDSNTLVKVISESGGFMQYIPGMGWLNTIGNMANTEGYYIKVATVDSIQIEGSPISLPFEIPFQTGWNIMGYPLVTSQEAVAALQPIMDNNSFVKVISESGGFIQYIPGLGWLNTMGNFEPDEGYYIKLIESDTLILTEPVSKILSEHNYIVEGEYYKRISNNNPYLPMHIVANFSENVHLEEGDELGVYIGRLCIGSAYISDPTSPIVTFLTTDDSSTDVVDGGIEGELMTFKLLHKGNEYQLKCQNKEAKNLNYAPLETRILDFTVFGLDTEDNNEVGFHVSEVIPNPFTKKAKIYVNIPNQGNLKVSILSLRGVVVKQLFSQDLTPQNKEIEIDGSYLNAGMYFVLVEFSSDGSKEEVLRKVVVK